MILSSCLAHVERYSVSWLCRSRDRETARTTRPLQSPANKTLEKGRDAGQEIQRSGYLLLEVLLALAVLSISVVMIFKIIQTTLKVTADITFLQTQQRKVDGIYELLRRNFDSMPQTCTFQTRTVNGSLELIFRSAPFNFSWVTAGANFGTVVIGSRPQVDGRLALSILQEGPNALDSYVDSGSEKKADWFPVMNDAEQIAWRFFDVTSGKWSSDWPDIANKPNLVELTFKLAGRGRTERCLFRWPIASTGS
jgi:hypothetical protein